MSTQFMEFVVDGESEVIEPDWKVLFGALAVQVALAFAYEDDPDANAEHMVKAMNIIESVYTQPVIHRRP